MIKTLIEKEEMLSDYSTASDLGGFIRLLESRLKEKKQVVCQLTVNGMILTEADEKRLSGLPLNEIRFIEVESQELDRLLPDLIDGWIQELPLMMDRTERLSREIKYKGFEGNLKAFVDILDGCQLLIDSLVSLSSTLPCDSQGEKIRWQKAEEMTIRTIGEALKAFEIKDFVLLSEILEYDLNHALQVWHDEMRSLRTIGNVEGTSAGGSGISE